MAQLLYWCLVAFCVSSAIAVRLSPCLETTCHTASCFCVGKPNGLYPNPFDCGKYFQCDSGVATDRACLGTVFDAATSSCVQRESANCATPCSQEKTQQQRKLTASCDCENIARDFNPVCSQSTWLTYQNPCIATCQGVRDTFQGICTGDKTFGNREYVRTDGYVDVRVLAAFSDENYHYLGSTVGRARPVIDPGSTQIYTGTYKPAPPPPPPIGGDVAMRVTPDGDLYGQTIFKYEPSPFGYDQGTLDTKLKARRSLQSQRKLKAIIGKDQRTEVIDDVIPWSSTGLLSDMEDSSSWDCTGAVIGSNAVLTAGHCLVYNGQWFLQQIYFLPNLHRVCADKDCSSNKASDWHKWAHATTFRSWSAAGDWTWNVAVIKYYDDFAPSIPSLSYGFNCGEDKYEVATGGYAADKPTGSFWTSSCPVVVADVCSGSYAVANQCDVASGQLGGPVVNLNADYTIYGVMSHSATYIDGDNATPYNFFIAINAATYPHIYAWKWSKTP